MTLKEIEFLEKISHDLRLHANKWGIPLKEFIEVQKEKRERNISKSTKMIQEKRKSDKLYGRSRNQLNYQKKNTKTDTQDFSDLD